MLVKQDKTIVKAILLKKQSQVNLILQELTRCVAWVALFYQGYDTNSLNLLRYKLHEVGGNLKIYKNSLFKKAITQLNKESSSFWDSILLQIVGPIAICFFDEDYLNGLKILESSFENNEILFGWNKDRLFDNKELLVLANLPSKQFLYAQLSVCFNFPLSELVRTLESVIVAN